MKLRFGKEEEVTVLDEHGSTLTIGNTVHDYKPGQTYKKYQVRVKVQNQRQEFEEFMRFQTETEGKIDPSFHRKYNKVGDDKGYYYVIKKWTEAA